MADLKIDIKLHNRFDIEVIDAKTGKVKQQAQAENIILNALWDRLCGSDWNSNNYYFKAIHYGSGTGTPAVTDTSLFTFVGAKSCIGDDGNGRNGCTYVCNIAECWISCKRQIQLSESEVVGTNLSEVGIGYGTSAANLCTHAMLQDMNGNPVSILKTNTDIVNIYATVYVHWSSNQIDVFKPWISMGDRSGGFRAMICGTQKKAYFNDSYLGAYLPNKMMISKEGGASPREDQFSPYMGDITTLSFSSDVPNKKIIITSPRLPISSSNYNGIGGLWLYNDLSYYGSYGPAIFVYVPNFYQGNDITNEAIGTGDGVTTKFKTKFDFPENAKVYVNGIEQTSGVTVNRIPSGANIKLGAYMKMLANESTDLVNITSTASGRYETNSDTQTVFRCWSGRMFRNTLNNIGFASIKQQYGSVTNQIQVYGSNDLTNWNLVYNRTDGAVVILDSTTGFYKYYKCVQVGTSPSDWNSYQQVIFTLNSTDFKAIEFDTPPADGDVITADYHTPYIAKDEDHVLDVSFTLQFGEYTP